MSDHLDDANAATTPDQRDASAPTVPDQRDASAPTAVHEQDARAPITVDEHDDTLNPLGYTTSPIDPHASPAARNVLQFLYDLPDLPRDRARCLSGLQIGTCVKGIYWNDQADWPGGISALNVIQSQTQKVPAIWGVDLMEGVHPEMTMEEISDYSDALPRMQAHWSSGGLILAIAHIPNPEEGSSGKGGGGLRTKPMTHFHDLLDFGTSTGASYRSYLDRLASFFLAMQEGGAVILWRPFHEANLNGFWWGTESPISDDDFKAVWRAQWQYLTEVKGLHNLLWVWGQSGGNLSSRYPGDEWIDIFGPDFYTYGGETIGDASGGKRSAHKPWGITEYGPDNPASSPSAPDDHDFSGVLREVKGAGQTASFWVNWGGPWNAIYGRNWQSLYEDPWTINRDDLARLRTWH